MLTIRSKNGAPFPRQYGQGAPCSVNGIAQYSHAGDVERFSNCCSQSRQRIAPRSYPPRQPAHCPGYRKSSTPSMSCVTFTLSMLHAGKVTAKTPNKRTADFADSTDLKSNFSLHLRNLRNLRFLFCISSYHRLR